MTRFVRGRTKGRLFQLSWKRRTWMRHVLGVAAVAAVLWIGTANFAQGFG